MVSHLHLLLFYGVTSSLAAVLPRQGVTATPGPIVALSYSTFQGITNGGVDSFLGMPYAHPPVSPVYAILMKKH